MSTEYDIRMTRHSSPVDVAALITENERWGNTPAISLHESPPSESDAILYRNGEFNYSFAAQFAVVQSRISQRYDPRTVGYFYTAYSASPLAHTLRGYFDERLEPHPVISHISKKPDTKRLQETILSNSLTSTVILDEFVNKGTTLHAAKANLISAGMQQENIHLVGARIYAQLWKGVEVANELKFADLDPETHDLAGQFYRAGRLLAQKILKS